MIVTEYYREREDGIKLFRTYSDAHKYVSREGESVKYEEIICSEDRLGVFIESEEEIVNLDWDNIETIDIEGAGYTYEETDTLIEEELINNFNYE